MRKKMIEYAGLVTGLVVWYVFFAVVGLSFNPIKWGWLARAVFAAPLFLWGLTILGHWFDKWEFKS